MATPQFTVTGTLSDLLGNGVNASSVVFTLVNYGANPPRVAGTNVFVQPQVTVTAAAGVFTATLFGNDVISPAGTYYTVSYVGSNGAVVQIVPYQFNGSGSFDISTLVPLVVSPTTPAPPNAVLLNPTQLQTIVGFPLSVPTLQAATVQSSSAPVFDITHPTYGAVCDGVTDDTNALNAALLAASNAGGGVVTIPAKTCLIAGQVTIPNDGATPPKQKTLAIKGVGAGGVLQFFPDGGCNGGSILNMTHSTTTGKIDSRGLGKLEITGICFKDTNTDFTPFIFDTLTNVHIHDNQFYGNTSHFASPPTQNGQDCIILGGTGTTVDGTASSVFQGYGSIIRNNQFDYCGRAVLLQNQTNSVNIESNHIFNHCTNLTDGPITLNPGSNAAGYSIRGAVIQGNLIEVGESKYGIHLVQNVIGSHIVGNSCWDANIGGGGVSTNCVKSESSAGNSSNVVLAGWFDNNTGNLPDSPSTLDIQIGGFPSRIGYPNQTNISLICNPAGVGPVNAPTYGISNFGGAMVLCGAGNVTHVFNSNTGSDTVVGSGGTYSFFNAAAPVPGSGSIDTTISRSAAGVVQIGTNASNNSGTLAAKITQTARIKTTLGTSLVAGDFALSAGWGATATVSTIQGTDSGFILIITASGAGQAANPTVTLTFHDGSFGGGGVVPVAMRGDQNAPTTAVWTNNNTGASATVFTFLGTPVAGNTYQMNCIIFGR